MDRLEIDLMHLYRDLLKYKDWEKRVENRISGKYGYNMRIEIEKYINLKDKFILDLGSGYGDFTLECLKNNYNIDGTEPDIITRIISDTRLKNYNKHIFKDFGENLIFDSNIFDVIVCNRVLEHTNKSYEILEEIIRTLKPEGKAYITVPNYIYPYEEHYEVFTLIPVVLIPKTILMRTMLYLKGTNIFLDGINTKINTLDILNFLDRRNIQIRNITEEKLEQKYGIFSKVLKYFSPSFEFIIIKR